MALVGGKARRRRDDGLMPVYVDVYLKRLCQSYDFYRGDEQVEKAELKTFFLAWLRAVPDAQAEACGAKSILVSEPARKTLAADLYDAITSQWRPVYNPKLVNVGSRGGKRV
jgi:hypothetical protein